MNKQHAILRDETPGVDGSGETAAKAPAKPKTEYTEVDMKDGRKVQFAGSRQADKSILEDNSGIRIDFRSGDSITLLLSDLSDETKMRAMLHGLLQKVGDEYSGEKKVEDMVLAAESMVDRLKKGDWAVARQAGDGFSGASVVIRAIVEASGKTVEDVKAFLNKKLETAKAAGEKLTRADLYNSFRNPNSKTGVIIERLEKEERTKNAKFSADDLLNEVNAG